MPSRCSSLLVAALLAASCAPAREPESPRAALTAYAAALREGRTKDAYALLSEEARKSMPFEAFERMVRESPEEVRALTESLSRPAVEADVVATITAASGETLTLRQEGGQWRVDRSAIDLYSQDSPETAVRSFVRALRNRRWDIALRFAPDSKRAGLDAKKLQASFEGEQREEIDRLVQALSAALPTARLELLGDRATMSYGEGGTVELVREHGAWKIEEF